MDANKINVDSAEMIILRAVPLNHIIHIDRTLGWHFKITTIGGCLKTSLSSENVAGKLYP